MTTATTPRQSAKRAKGRAHALTVRYNGWDSTLSQIIDEGEHYLLRTDEYDQAVERMARAMSKEHYGFANYLTEIMRDNARAALKSIGIAAPRKERKQP